MEPALVYAWNRREALVASMVGAAMATMPRHAGTLRGSDASMAASASPPEEPEISKSMMEDISERAHDA